MATWVRSRSRSHQSTAPVGPRKKNCLGRGQTDRQTDTQIHTQTIQLLFIYPHTGFARKSQNIHIPSSPLVRSIINWITPRPIPSCLPFKSTDGRQQCYALELLPNEEKRKWFFCFSSSNILIIPWIYGSNGPGWILCRKVSLLYPLWNLSTPI